MRSPVTYRAALDFLDIDITTVRSSNAWTVQTEAGVTYAHALDAGPGGSASQFRLRLQDPACFDRVEAALHRVDERWGLADAPNLAALELAFDTYLPGASQADLAAIVLERCRWSTHKPEQDWHAYRTREDGGRIYLNQLSIHQAERGLAAGWNVVDTPTKDASVRYHGYVKVADANRPLPVDEWRARFEVTLKADALPVRLIDDLRGFDFCSIANRFRFRRYEDAPPHPSIAVARTGAPAGYQVGERGPYRRRVEAQVAKYSGTREFRAWTSQDTVLNDAVYAALRRLTRSWQSKA